MGDMIVDAFIALCLEIDKMIYGINVLLFQLFLSIANARIKDQIFIDFFNRIYVIIGIFMIFKVAFSLIQMLSNPDLMTDKEKGAGKLASQIVIALGLIIMVPSIFTMAFNLQGAILGDNIIGKLLFGGTFDEGDNTGNVDENTITGQGKVIAYQVWSGMISVPEGRDENHPCVEAYKNNANGSYDLNQLINVDGTWCLTDKIGGERILEYRILISSIATGMVAWLMVGFCIDIAVRFFKLGAYELLAPVCIVTYVGGGKDNAFNKWVKATLSSYISLFIKLITIYFMIYMASVLTNRSNIVNYSSDGLFNVALILGLLVFAKSAPKLIGDLFGVQPDEESGFKGLAKAALLGAGALTVGAATGGIGSALSRFQGARAAGNGIGRSLLAGGTGLFAGAAAGGLSGIKDKNLLKAGRSGLNIAQRNGQQALQNGRTSWFQRTAARTQETLGMDTKAASYDRQIEGYNSIQNRAKELQDYASGEVAKDNSTLTTFTYNGTKLRHNANYLKHQVEYLKANGGTAAQIQTVSEMAALAEKQAISDFITNNSTTDSSIAAGISEINALNQQYGLNMATVTDGASVQGAKVNAIESANNITSSEDYIKSQEVKRAVSNKKS